MDESLKKKPTSPRALVSGRGTTEAEAKAGRIETLETALWSAIEDLDAWVSHRDDLIRSGYDVDYTAMVSARAKAALMPASEATQAEAVPANPQGNNASWAAPDEALLGRAFPHETSYSLGGNYRGQVANLEKEVVPLGSHGFDKSPRLTAGAETPEGTTTVARPLEWIVGGMSITAYANAFGLFGFYRILGERAPWSLQYPEGTCFRTDEGFETQAAARRFAQDHYAGLVREALLP